MRKPFDLTPLKPDWFAPLHEVGRRSDALPLWRFTLQPNYGELADVRSSDGEG